MLFDFLEVNSDEHKENKVYSEIICEIPDDQYLKYSDLITIAPDSNALKRISKKILDKYIIVPLYVQIPATKPFLPKHLKSDFWGNIQGEKNLTMYVAMNDPLNNQILNILKSITGYNIISIPLETESGKKFLKNNYEKVKNNLKNKSEPAPKKNDLIKLFKDNYFYLVFFSFIIILLVFVKTLIIKA